MTYLNTSNVANILGVKKSTVDKLCAKGIIHGARDVLSNVWEIPKSWFENYYHWLIDYVGGDKKRIPIYLTDMLSIDVCSKTYVNCLDHLDGCRHKII